MQLLLSNAALDRVRDRIAPFVGDLDIVTIAGPKTFQRNGKDIADTEVMPDIVWTTLDAYGAGLLGGMFKVILGPAKIQWMQTFNAGLDTPIFKQIMAKGIRLTKSNAQGVAIAEYVVGNAISLILPIDQQRDLQSQKVWQSTPYREVSQSRWTLVGYGAIGREIAKRIKPWGAHLSVVRRSVEPDDLADSVVGTEALPQLLPRSDVVVLACALTDETRNMVDAKFLGTMKTGSILLNIGRGGLIDEDALRASLDKDQPARAVLDVFQTEPLPADHWIWSHPKIRATAHTSHAGNGTLARGDDLFVSNLELFLAGKPLRHEAAPWEVGL